MKKIYILTCLQSIVLCLAVGALYAQPGSIDSSFGINGFVETDNLSNEHAIGIQNSGKIIRSVGRNDFGLKRYNYDGKADSTFGTDGVVTIDVGILDNLLLFAIQPDDGIVAFGQSDADPYIYVVCRYNKDGKLDSTLGINGILKLTMTSNDIFITSMIVGAGGEIMLAGATSFNNSTPQSFVILRLNSHGEPDANFGINGLVITPFSESSVVKDVQLRPDGKIIAVGKTSFSDNQGNNFDSVAIARYNNNGSLDKTFSEDGKLTFVQKDSEHLIYGGWAEAVALQPDEKIVVTGLAGNTQSHGRWTIGDYAIWRLNKDGTFDSSFGEDGVVLIDLSAYELSSDMVIDTSGKIIISGNSGGIDLFYPRTKVIRLNTDGSIDATFGDNGIATLPAHQSGGEDNSSESIALGEHRIYVSGQYVFGGSERFVIALKTDTFVAPHDTTTLPFSFTAFSGNVTGNTIQLSWQTSNENHLKPFVIERGKDSLSFHAINTSAAANNGGSHTYIFNDPVISDTTVGYYYRIKASDNSGTTEFTHALKFTVVVVPPVVDSPDVEQKITITPNPVTANSKLVISLPAGKTIDIAISNSSGRIMYQNHQRYPAGNSIINIPFNALPHGMYYIKIKGSQVNMNKTFKK